MTPFYTHLNKNGEECGLLVSRGWLPLDLSQSRMHYESKTLGHIEGVLYTGDQKSKYTYKNNVPVHGQWWRADP